LAAAGCDAFVNLAPPVNQYLTGFRGSTSAVLITMDKALFLCDFRYAEQAGDQVCGDFEREEVKGDFVKRAGERLADVGAAEIAFEPASVTVSDLLTMQEACGRELKPAPDIVSALRAVKTADEVEKIRAAQYLAEGVLADLLKSVEEGTTERELAASFDYEFKRRGAGGASFDTIALFGPRSSLPHGEPSSKSLCLGDVVLLDFGCRLDGYCSDLTRTYAFGRIPGVWFEEAYDLTLTAHRIAVEAVRPGISCRELDAVARDLICDAGYGEYFGHGLGHGVGIEIHEAPRVNHETETLLEPGMVITIEPGVYLPGQGGIRIEDLVVVTEDGIQNLTTAPKELRVLGA